MEEAAGEYGFDLLISPPYSPNLNLIDRRSKLVKNRYLNTRYHEDSAVFKTAIDGCLDGLNTTLRDVVLSLQTFKFQFIPTRQT